MPGIWHLTSFVDKNKNESTRMWELGRIVRQILVVDSAGLAALVAVAEEARMQTTKMIPGRTEGGDPHSLKGFHIIIHFHFQRMILLHLHLDSRLTIPFHKTCSFSRGSDCTVEQLHDILRSHLPCLVYRSVPPSICWTQSDTIYWQKESNHLNLILRASQVQRGSAIVVALV